MKLIIGLGNPGSEYANTRHNVGFRALEYFASMNNWPVFGQEKRFKSNVSQHNLVSGPAMLVQPQTFMNESGQAVQLLMQFYKLSPADVLVIYDELDLEFGKVRSRTGGSSAGHNGIKSLISHIGADFARVRIGIKNADAKHQDSTDFVLNRFSQAEEAKLPQIFDYTNQLINEFLTTGRLDDHTEFFI